MNSVDAMSTTVTTIDGRTARRERNIDAVLGAAGALIREGHSNPSWEAVAARAGVSLRSVQRYFPDREELLLAFVRQQQGPTESLCHIERAGQGDLPGRIERFVAHRVRVHQVLAPTARLADATADHMPVLAEVMAERRAALRRLVDVHFAPELEPHDEDRRTEIGETVDLLCQLESLETLRVVRGLDPHRVQTLLVSAVSSVLQSAAAPSGGRALAGQVWAGTRTAGT